MSLGARMRVCLVGTLSPDANIRIKAELRLNELLPYPEAGVALASIIASPVTDIPLRQSASIILRKYVKEHWSPYFQAFKGSAPQSDVKNGIRTAVFQALSDPSSKVRSGAANVVSLVANSDWPDEYPDLLNNLLALLSSQNTESVHGAMQVLTEMVKDDLTEDQLLPVLRQLLPVLMNILGDPSRHSAVTRARSVAVFRQCLSALYMVKDQYPQTIKEAVESVLPQWIDAFKVLINQDPAAEVANPDNWDALLIRLQIFKTLNNIQTIFNRIFKSSAETFLNASLTHLQVLLPAFAQYYLDPNATPPSSTEDEEVSLPGLASSIIDFVSNLARTSSVRPWFDPSRLEQLSAVVFHWIQMTGEDEETWASNANAFVAHEEEETQEYNLRVAGLDLLAGLLDRYSPYAVSVLQVATERLIQESNQARQQGSQEWWRPLEAALAAVGSQHETVLEAIEDEVASNRPKPFDVESLLINVIPSLLTLTEYPFLQGRCFVFASQYAKCLPSGMSSQYLDAAISVLEAPEPGIPVKVSAVKAIRNFCAQMDNNTVVPLAPRMIKDLGPFLAATTEDTLTLVLEAINVIIEIDDGNWLTPELGQALSQAVLQVWTRNIKDPITLSVLDDLLSDLTHSPAPGVYQVVVSESLPVLVQALKESPSTESWIASSAIDLISSLARGATKGNLGEGFFAAFAPALFACLQRTEDQEVLENAVVLLTYVVRKDPGQLLSWTDEQGQPGLGKVLELIGKLLSPSDSESGGLVVGDLIIHLLRNAGDAVLPVLPDLIRAMTTRMTTARTGSLLQSLIIPLAFLIHTHRDSVLSVLESFTVEGSHPPKSGLEVFIPTWMENAVTIQGLWSQRVSTLALCSLLLSGRPSLQNLQVKGDMILKPETSDVIITRSRAKQTPHEFQSIRFPVKALKLILEDLNPEVDASDIPQGDLASDDGNSDWDDSDDGGEKLIQGFKPEEFAYLSDLLGGKPGQFGEDDDIIDGGLDDEDLKQDSIYTMDMKSHLVSFLRECAQRDPNSFRALVDPLNAKEILLVQKVVEGN
ncbi:hypothetical protein M422DRAFT_76407 [Sphaerobolus stellatus SS14]|uniref:Unplaced genomic scaffold SPHSTscaffold_122, whole genome shotgun sequence n=1 Tax=Sphaerobolus stellatus (strain SS14) TaxID=990650 RepID=A0A0C9UZB5_SPHS4|nr:hypothetical protein M422DRAFT_76407 [Sphaerobolus stellatus SS14]